MNFNHSVPLFVEISSMARNASSNSWYTTVGQSLRLDDRRIHTTCQLVRICRSGHIATRVTSMHVGQSLRVEQMTPGRVRQKALVGVHLESVWNGWSECMVTSTCEKKGE